MVTASAKVWLCILLLCGGTACGSSLDEDTAQHERRALRALLDDRGVEPLVEGAFERDARWELGRMLFFDPILSGNRDQSCSTCHHPSHAGTDGRSLSVGTKAVEVDGVRMPGPDHTFIPRNALALWDLEQRQQIGHAGGFWDRRLVVEQGRFVLYDVGYAASEVPRLVLPQTLDSLVAAVSLLPVLDRDEMRGEVGESASDGSDNELAMIFDSDFEGVWKALMVRLLAIDGYRELFANSFPDTPEAELHFAHAANAIGRFIRSEFQSTQTPWDRFVEGDDTALSPEALRGAGLFFGRADCASCHGDELMGDDAVHNYAIVPMATGPESDDEDVDLGAALRTNTEATERYAFRTPPLRNVAQTGPWMHNGCYTSLKAVVMHKRAPAHALRHYDREQLSPEFRPQVHGASAIIEDVASHIGADVPLEIELSERDIDDLVAFLHSLSSPRIESLSELTPHGVPSGHDIVDP